jgi:hypothetical protein
MTVCVAATAQWSDENGRHEVILVASDRMITSREIREYELADQTKAKWPRDNLLFLMSGSIDSLLEVAQATERAMAQDGIISIPAIAHEFAEQFSKFRDREIEQKFFRPFGLTIKDFVDGQNKWPTEFTGPLHRHLRENSRLGSALIVGFDDNGAHIYTVVDPGYEQPWNGTGYAAIGIGDEHAEAEIIKASYTPKRHWLEAMRIVFFAKKRAEEAPGVGFATDLWHITEGGARYFEPRSNTVQALDKMYFDWRQAERQAISANASELPTALNKDYGADVPQPQDPDDRTKAEDEAGRSAGGTNDKTDISGGAEEGESKG